MEKNVDFDNFLYCNFLENMVAYISQNQEQEAINVGKEVRILIAGGNPDLRRLLAALIDREADLRAVGVTALGAEALELVMSLSPDLIITDGDFSDMGRRDFLERLALMDEDTRPAVIALSRGRGGVRSEGLTVAGIDKPRDLRSLADEIRRTAHLRASGKPEWAVGTNGEYGLYISATRILRELCVPTHLAGYFYLREAAVMTAMNVNLIGAVTKELYPDVARKFGVAPSQVERAMRTVIEYAWSAADSAMIWKYFGPTQSRKPSNSEFISVISDKLYLQKKYVESIG